MTGKPTPVKRYHDYLLQTVNDLNVFNRWFVSPLNLGGVPGEGGGSGVPLAGIIGQLIQSKVAYDTTEATSLDVPASGQSLVHNLNRIRYWLNLKSGNVVVLDEGVEIASGVRVLDFLGAPVTVTLTSGYTDRVNVTISGTGGGGGDVVMVSSDDTTPNYLENKVTAASSKITVTTANPGGNEERQVDFGAVNIDDLDDVVITSVGNDEILGYSGGWINRTIGEAAIAPAVHTHLEVDITNLDHDAVKIQGTNVSVISPANHDILTYSAGGEWLPSGLGAAVDNYTAKVSSDDTTDAFLEAKIVAGTNVTVTVLNPGANETLEINSTASGGGGGSAIDAYDEGISIASGITSLDWVGNQLTATADGTDVTVTLSGIVVNPPEFIGVKTYRTTNQQLTTSNGWQNVDWTTEDYDTDSMWSTTSNQNVNTAGYYNIIGQVTMSGAIPQTERFEFAIFKNSTVISKHWDGFYTTVSGNRTLHLEAESYFLDTDYIRVQILCGTADQPYILSGIDNSFLASHMIQGIFIEGAAPEVCRVVYTSYLTVADATDTAIPWSSETYDTGSFWDSGSSTRFTISTAGYYNMKATGLWESVYYQGVTPFTIRLAFLKNGTTKLGNHWDWNDVNTGGARSEGLSTHISTDAYLEVDDYIEVVAYHEKGSSGSNIIRANDTYATIQRLA